ncbi:hypothetical protein [Dapis sp. BLCC M229]
MCKITRLIGIPIGRFFTGERGYKYQHFDKQQINQAIAKEVTKIWKN